MKLDPKAKKFVFENDSQRSMRAYEIKKYTKKSLYDWTEKTKSNFDPAHFKKFFINPSRDFLLKKINMRVNKMFKEGAKREVQQFLKIKIHPELSANKVIGIQEKKLTLKEVKNLIQIRTRKYAKRQFTWARGKMGSWQTINPKNYKGILEKIIN